MNRLKETFLNACDPAGNIAAVAAFLFFLSAAWFLYAQGLKPSLSTAYIGDGHDPAGYIWSLVWWPYAIRHGFNPFISRVIWTPVGFNLAWAAAIPGPSLIVWPITQWLGPIVSFNILMIFTPAVVAECTFLLCRYITGKFFASVCGGYLFGFSPYMLGHMLLGQLNLTLIFGVPLCVYLVLLGVDRAVSKRVLVFALAAVLVLQFLTSTEIVALISLFGGAALVTAMFVLPTQQRTAVLETIVPIGLAYLVLGIVVVPYIYYAFAPGVPEQMHPVEKCSADFMGYFVPSPMMLFGGKPFAHFADTLTPHVWYAGKGVYTNPALLALLSLYSYRRWRTPVGKLLIISAIVVIVCSFGPQFHVLDRPLMNFPWRWLMRLPTFNQALPVRFAMLFFLILSIVTAVVMSDAGIPKSIRIALGLLAIVLLLPNRHFRLTVPHKDDTPPFFDTAILQNHVERGATLLIFPFSIQGTSLLWQARTEMYFRMVGGYISTYVPPDYRPWPVVDMMLDNEPARDFASELRPFLAHYQVNGIVLAPEAQAKWSGPIGELGITPEPIGGVLFYPIASSSLSGDQVSRTKQ